MSVYSEASVGERAAIRREMITQAEEILNGLCSTKAQTHAAAKKMVDAALSKERNEHGID